MLRPPGGTDLLSVLVCSAAIEVMHSVTALGTCQTADVVRNVTGAVIASAAAALILRVLATDDPSGAAPAPGDCV